MLFWMSLIQDRLNATSVSTMLPDPSALTINSCAVDGCGDFTTIQLDPSP